MAYNAYLHVSYAHCRLNSLLTSSMMSAEPMYPARKRSQSDPSTPETDAKRRKKEISINSLPDDCLSLIFQGVGWRDWVFPWHEGLLHALPEKCHSWSISYKRELVGGDGGTCKIGEFEIPVRECKPRSAYNGRGLELAVRYLREGPTGAPPHQGERIASRARLHHNQPVSQGG